MAVPTTGSASSTEAAAPLPEGFLSCFTVAAFLIPLFSFSAIAGFYLLFGSIDTAISPKYLLIFLLILLFISLKCFSCFYNFFAVFDERYQPLSLNSLLSGIFTLCVWIWIVAACKKLSYTNSIVYFSFFVASHVIRLFAQSFSIAESKNDQFVKEHLTDTFSYFGNWIYFFCLYFLPAIEFFIRGIYYPEFIASMYKGNSPFYFSSLVFFLLCFECVKLFAHLSREENTKSFSFLITSEIMSLLELLVIIFGQVFLLNPFCLILLVVIWMINKVIATRRFLIKLDILPIVNSSPVSSV